MLQACSRLSVDAAGMQQALKTQGQLKSWKKLLNGAICAAAQSMGFRAETSPFPFTVTGR
jgi:hypothetical protein